MIKEFFLREISLIQGGLSTNTPPHPPVYASDRNTFQKSLQSLSKRFYTMHWNCNLFSCPDGSLEECPTCPPGLAGLVNCTNCETTASVNCTSCHNSCDSCAGPGPGNCTGCLPDEVLRDGFCLNCENGFYLSDTSQTCSLCHSSCSTCRGPDPNQCMSCSGSLFYKWF